MIIIKGILKRVIKSLKLTIRQYKWRKNNKQNYTNMNNLFPIDVVSVGNYTYGNLNVHYYKNESERLEIGNFCSIADNVHFFLAGEHDYNNLTTFPLKNYITKDKVNESITKGPIIVGDDVWIGYGAIILSGVNIGRGCVIGANSVVTKDIPPYSIYAGNKIIKKRFDDEIIEKLMKIDFQNIDLNNCNKNIDLFYTNINSSNVDDILSKIKEVQ